MSLLCTRTVFLLRAFVLSVLATLFMASGTASAQVTYDSIVYNRGTFFGNANNDAYLLHMAVDAQGNVYGTGLCSSIPTTAGAYKTTNQGGIYDVMVFKMDPTMKTLIWATYIGGNGVDAGGSIAVSPSGEVFVSGYTLSTNFPVSVASDATYLTGAVAYFALKLSADGSTLQYSRILGRGAPVTQQTAAASKGAHVAINPSGEAFVYSHTNNAAYQISGNAYQSTIAGSTDFVLTKLSATGAVLYSTYFGGTGAEISYDISYANGKVYCTGTTMSAGLPLRTGKVPDASGDCCVFVADDGSVCAPRRCYVYGTAGTDQGYAVWYDSRAHRICLTGTFGSTPTFPYTALQTGQTSGGFISSADTSLTGTNSVSMIGSFVIPTSVVTRTSNSAAYVAGYITAGTVPVSPNGFQTTPRGSLDGFMISVDSVGTTLRYGTYMGGSGQDYSAAKVLLVDRGCLLRVIFGITTHSTNFPSTTNTYQPSKLNGIDDQPALAMFATTPTASLTATGKPCSREAVLTFSSSCPFTNLRWNFGDNTQASGTNPITHAFPGIGIYKVTATAVTTEGDTIVKTQDVAVGSSSPIDAGPDRTVCKNQATQLSASGAVTYVWSPGGTLSDSTIANPIARPTKTTMYQVRGKDSFGCESVDSVLVIVREIKASVSSDTTICEGSVVQLVAQGGTYYSWIPTTGLNLPNGAVVLARPQTTTTYTVVAYDGICFDTQRVTITIIPRPKLRFAAVPGICANTPVELHVFVSGGGAADSSVASYAWTPKSAMSDASIPNPVVRPDKDSWYKVTVTMRNGCVVTDSLRVPIQTKLRITVNTDTTFCIGGTVRLRANGATQYAWSPSTGLSDSVGSSPQCTPTKTTTYTVIGTSGACIDTQRVTVTVRQRPRSVQAFGDTTVCSDDRVHLRATSDDSSGVSFSWFPRADFENPDGASAYLRATASRTYVVVATNAYGCTSTDSVRVNMDNALTVQAGPDATACEGETVRLRILSSHDSLTQFTWMPNDGAWDRSTNSYNVTVGTSKKYTVLIQRGSCKGVVEMSVTAKQQPVFTVSNDTTVCFGEDVRLGAFSSQPGIRYHWLVDGIPDTLLDDAQASRPTARALTAARRWVVEADLDGCIKQMEVRAGVYALPDSIPSLDTNICAGEYATLVIPPSGPNVRYAWDPPTGLSATSGRRVTAAPETTTTYTITSMTDEGCVRTRQVTVGVRRRVRAFFSIDPINDGKLLLPGDTVQMVINAVADSAISTPLSFDVVINANIYDVQSHPYSDRSGLRYIHVNVPAFAFALQKVPIAVITGKVLQGSPSYSGVTIENIVTDSAICPTLSTSPSVMGITSCFNEGRNVELVVPLTLTVSPNPTDNSARVSVTTSEHGAAVIEVYNSIGMLVQSMVVPADGTSASGTILDGRFAAGLYTVLVRTQQQTAHSHVLKR